MVCVCVRVCVCIYIYTVKLLFVKITTMCLQRDRKKFLNISIRCKAVPVTTSLRVLRLRMEDRTAIWRVAANKLNKQSRTADKG
jgi:hypothetical protein